MTLHDIIMYHLSEALNKKNSKKKRTKHMEMHDYLVLMVDALTVLQQPR